MRSQVTHTRNTRGRALCGTQPRKRVMIFADREPPTCRSCQVMSKPEKVPKVQALTDAELLELDLGWRNGWAQEFPGEEYPGLVEARRRIREKLAPAWATTPPGDERRPR